MSELAKLVTSGAVQVPKSLVNYASDKALLLDQVFTVLSPSDINGMLPDILKASSLHCRLSYGFQLERGGGGGVGPMLNIICYIIDLCLNVIIFMLYNT